MRVGAVAERFPLRGGERVGLHLFDQPGRNPGSGDSVANVRTSSTSRRSSSTTCLMSSLPRCTPASPGWGDVME